MKTSEFVVVSYKQCIKALESSTYESLTELRAVQQKCTEALISSRRIHSLIQSKYDKARSDNSKQLTNVSLSSSTSCSTQTPGLTSPLSTRSVPALHSLLYPHMPIGKVWIYRLLFVCFFVRLRISPPRIKLAASNFARRFIGVQGRESPSKFCELCSLEAQKEAQNWMNRPASARATPTGM